MYQQINITLLQKTIELIDGLATQDERSKLIDEAINFYVIDRQKQSLQQQLQEGAIRHSSRDLSLAEDWFNLEQESIEQSKLVMD
jgi:CopG family transcriptional regulator / antitoxin EndoAI